MAKKKTRKAKRVPSDGSRLTSLEDLRAAKEDWVSRRPDRVHGELLNCPEFRDFPLCC